MKNCSGLKRLRPEQPHNFFNPIIILYLRSFSHLKSIISLLLNVNILLIFIMKGIDVDLIRHERAI